MGIEIDTYLRSPSGDFTRIADVDAYVGDARHVSGAIEFVVNGQPVLDRELWDDAQGFVILTYLCFVPGALAATVVADLVELDLGFTPDTLRSDQFGGPGGVAFNADAVARLRSLAEVAVVSIEGGASSFRLAGMGGWPGQVVVWETTEWPPEALVEAASELRGFSAALVGDADDVFWQSADQVNTYQVFDRAWEHLPKTRDEVFDRDKIDISLNPGRQAPAPGMWLWAAAKMWFGPGAFSLIDRDRLLDLPVGRVEPRSDGVVVVELFDLAASIESIRDTQATFRDWMGYDDLEARAPELADALEDPRAEFETGVFGHGGVRRVTEWLDAGRLVPRSMATRRRTIELDADGTILWEDDRPTGSDFDPVIL